MEIGTNLKIFFKRQITSRKKKMPRRGSRVKGQGG